MPHRQPTGTSKHTNDEQQPLLVASSSNAGAAAKTSQQQQQGQALHHNQHQYNTSTTTPPTSTHNLYTTGDYYDAHHHHDGHFDATGTTSDYHRDGDDNRGSTTNTSMTSAGRELQRYPEREGEGGGGGALLGRRQETSQFREEGGEHHHHHHDDDDYSPMNNHHHHNHHHEQFGEHVYESSLNDDVEEDEESSSSSSELHREVTVEIIGGEAHATVCEHTRRGGPRSSGAAGVCAAARCRQQHQQQVVACNKSSKTATSKSGTKQSAAGGKRPQGPSLGQRSPSSAALAPSAAGGAAGGGGVLTLPASHVAINKKTGKVADKTNLFSTDQHRRDAEVNAHNIWLSKWLFRLKTYFLFLSYIYMLVLALCGAVLFMIFENSEHEGVMFVDAIFVAISCITCTGLTTVNVGNWTDGSSAVRHILMVTGGMVFTSSTGPLLRLYTLHKLMPETEVDDHDNHRTRSWKARKQRYIRQLFATTHIALGTTALYWVSFQLFGFVMIMITSAGEIPPRIAIQRVIAAFQSCGFNGMAKDANSISICLFMALLCASGNTLYPVCLRGFMHFERAILKAFFSLRRKGVCHRLRMAFSSSGASAAGDSGDESAALFRGGGGRVSQIPNNSSGLSQYAAGGLGANASHASMSTTLGGGGGGGGLGASTTRDSDHLPRLNNPWSVPITKHESRYERAFDAILASKNPVTYHYFLFMPSETRYLFVAWVCIVVFQFVPFLAQQWSGDNAVLARFDPIHKIVVAFSQSVLVRFAGITLVPTTSLYNAHILILLFAMYVPAVPIPTDRTRRKWNLMMRAGVWRLATSRLFWLFSSVITICFIEENQLYDQVANTRFDVSTRVLFEVVSAYSTSGMTLCLHPDMSFSASLSTPSKIILFMVMLVGRHRGMDLGLDIGFTDLQQKEKEVEEEEERRLLDEHQQQRLSMRSHTTSESGKRSPTGQTRSPLEVLGGAAVFGAAGATGVSPSTPEQQKLRKKTKRRHDAHQRENLDGLDHIDDDDGEEHSDESDHEFDEDPLMSPTDDSPIASIEFGRGPRRAAPTTSQTSSSSRNNFPGFYAGVSGTGGSSTGRMSAAVRRGSSGTSANGGSGSQYQHQQLQHAASSSSLRGLAPRNSSGSHDQHCSNQQYQPPRSLGDAGKRRSVPIMPSSNRRSTLAMAGPGASGLYNREPEAVVSPTEARIGHIL